MKTICYYGHDWAGNIGNAFIDYTIKYCIRAAMEDSQYPIIEASNLPAYLKYNFAKRKPFNWFGFSQTPHVDFDLRTMMKPDVVVMGAALLDVYWSKIHAGLLEWLRTAKTKVIILGGGGGNDYSVEEIKYVEKAWRGIDVIAYIARDEKAYDNFKNLSGDRYLGIDNAFFLADCFTPAHLNLNGKKLGIKTFDLTADRKIEFPKDYLVVSLRHRLMDVDSLKGAIKQGLRTYSIIGQTDLISDFPDDYLHLYGNASQTHSDRVHACVATLSFGGAARYYDKSDRSWLFERVKCGAIRNELTTLDQNYIKEEKDKQINYLRSILEKI